MKNICRKLIVMNLSVMMFVLLGNISYNSKRMKHHNTLPTPIILKGQQYEENSVWTRISDDIFVYSAYCENRSSLPDVPFVRILSIVKLKGHKFNVTSTYLGKEYKSNDYDIHCNLWYENRSGRRIVLANITTRNVTISVFEEGLKKYATSDHTHYPTKLLKLHYKNIVNRTDSIGICVRSLYGPYDDIKQLTQFLAYYSSMNVTQFTFYLLSISPKVQQYLNQVTSIPQVQINLLPWNLPTGSWSDLWDFGALVALNDCIYRSQSSIVIALDLDEYIMPKDGRQFNNFLELWKYLDFTRKTVQEPVGYAFRNVFFCKEYMKNSCSNKTAARHKSSCGFNFEIFTNSEREKRIWPARLRTKLMFRPQKVVSLGHHTVTQYALPATGISVVSSRIAVLQHYRQCSDVTHENNNKGTAVLTSSVIFDSTALQFKERVMNSPFVKIFLDMTSELTV